MKKKIIYLIPLAVLVLIGFIGFYAISKNHEKQSLVTAYDNKKIVPFPEFSLRNLYDQTQVFSKKDLIGKFSVINVFASWCSTCYSEHKLLLEMSGKGIINIYGIAWRDIDENTMRYLEKNGNPYLKVASDSKGTLSEHLGLTGVPESFLVNKEGMIVLRYRGVIDERFMSYVENLVREEI